LLQEWAIVHKINVTAENRRYRPRRPHP